mgnify:CR=1 FL=1
MNNRRKKHLVDSSVQGALVRRILLHWLMFLALTLVMLPAWQLISSGDIFRPFSVLVAESWTRTAPVFLALVAMMPLFAWDTVKFSHRFAGPMYRFRKTLQELAAHGEAPMVKLRNGDFWQEVADDFNAVLERLASDENDASSDETDVLACAGCGDPTSEA